MLTDPSVKSETHDEGLYLYYQRKKEALSNVLEVFYATSAKWKNAHNVYLIM